uniref:Zgc:123295 n=1 Tax=Sinocyclocheilus anshuiensis TaxID=1608454 RepID=A0A671NS69_9TELE
MKFNIALSFAGVILLYIIIHIFLLSSVCGRAPLNNKIVGGGRAKAAAWLWQVSIHVVGFGHHCGGTLITKDWVLSAAHCFQRFGVSNIVMYFGHLRQSGSNPYETSRTAGRIITHPNYDDYSLDNDIALIQLSSVNFSDYIRPVCLSTANSTFAAGTESWVTGWGSRKLCPLICVTGQFPKILQEVMIPVVSNSDCKNAYGWFFTRNMICAGLLNQGGKSICPGDSGGPMLSRNVLLEKKCDHPKYPSVFVRVSRYQDWIKSYTGSNPPGIVAFNPTSNSNYGRVPNLLLFPLSLIFSIIPFTSHSHFLKIV